MIPSGSRRALCFFVFCWLLLSVQICAFLTLGEINRCGILTVIATGTADALVILSPYLILSPRWRWSVIFPMVFFPAYLYANLLYLRNFGDMMGMPTMFGVSNATGVVADSALKSMRLADLWICIPFTLFLAIYCKTLKAISRNAFPLRLRISGIILCAVVFLVQQILIHDSNICRDSKSKDLKRRYKLQYCGFIPYMFTETIDFLKPKYIRLSESDKKDIEDYLIGIREKKLLTDSLPCNADKNLILIVVESFNSDALYVMANGRPAMPFTSSLLEKDGCIVLDNVMSQVGAGRSSDGRFIYQTGLLPIPGDPVAMTYTEARYPSLSGALAREGYEFDCGNPIQWNKLELSASYGFSKIFTREAMLRNMKKLGGKDPALFTNALPVIKEMKRPFYAALNTMDMHDPYEEYLWKKSDVWQDTVLSVNEKVYIEKCRQFDAALSRFIAALKENGLYSNSVIVIAGDHNARENALTGTTFVNPEIPIIILNSGITLRSHQKIGQIDLYPTLLDLMGVSGSEWRGLGVSIFRNPAVMHTDTTATVSVSGTRDTASSVHTDPHSYPSATAWRISDRLIRSGSYRP